MPHDTEEGASRSAQSGTPEPRPRPPVSSAEPPLPPPSGLPLTHGRRRPTAADLFTPARPDEPDAYADSAPIGPASPAPGQPVGPGNALREPGLDPPREAPRRRPAGRTIAAAVCLVLGVGLLGGAAAGTWLTGGGDASEGRFDAERGLWHKVPVDRFFPRTLKGKGAGPGGADRQWTRVAVAPDSGCRHTFDPTLKKALSTVGCARLLRATYADETTTSVTTVGLLFTRSDGAKMRALRTRFATSNLGERTDMMPRPYAARGTVAADFGDTQRASWTIRVLPDSPVVVFSVTGFADGRVVSDPQAAAQATEKGETSAPAEAGLGHDAQGIADRVERGLRKETARGTRGDSHK